METVVFVEVNVLNNPIAHLLAPNKKMKYAKKTACCLHSLWFEHKFV